MAQRYYIPADQVQKIHEILSELEGREPEIVADLKALIFGTEVPKEQAEELERQLRDLDSGFSM